MSFATQLLPGLRDVRGPLIAGYLWLFTGWLLLADHLPQRHDLAVYQHAFQVGDAVGQVGLAAAVSIAAYLIGSLLQAVPTWIDYGSRALAQRIKQSLFPSVKGSVVSAQTIKALLVNAPVYSLTDFRWVDGDKQTKRALKDLVASRLKKCNEDVDDALAEAVAKVRAGAAYGTPSTREGEKTRVSMKAAGGAEQGWVAIEWIAGAGGSAEEIKADEKVAIPSFSAKRDLFEERATIKTRLMETAQHAGAEVDRLFAESELRFTLAFPLAALAIVLNCESGDHWWLILFVAVFGLLVHSIVLRKQGGREMIEALRSRPDAETLDRITPVFATYEERAGKLAEALRLVNWEALGAAAAGRPQPSATPSGD